MSENWKTEVKEFEKFEFPPDPADDFDWSPATEEVAGELPDLPLQNWEPGKSSRRDFLRTVVCSGVAVSAGAYMFTSNSTEAKAAVRGVERLITLNINKL